MKMMIKICYVNIGKILQLKLRSYNDEEDNYFEGDLNVLVNEDGEVVTYHFSDPESLNDFLFLLEEDDIPYKIQDADGNLIGWVDQEDYDDDYEEDDEEEY